MALKDMGKITAKNTNDAQAKARRTLPDGYVLAAVQLIDNTPGRRMYEVYAKRRVRVGSKIREPLKNTPKNYIIL